MAEISLVVLAAGMGSRYGGLKQIDPVGPNGELLIEYSIYDALSVGIRRILFVIQQDQEGSFRDLLTEKLETRCDMGYVHQALTDLPAGTTLAPERRKPWGTGHAVLSARHAVDGPFAVINADDFYGRRSYAQIMGFQAGVRGAGDECALIGFDLKKTLAAHGTVSRGVCRVGGNGVLVGIDERTRVGLQGDSVMSWDADGNPHRLPDDAIASMNMWAFPNGFMERLEAKFSQFLEAAGRDAIHDEFFLPSAVSDLVAEKRARVRVLPTSEEWMGMTYREDITRVRGRIGALIEDGVYPHKLWRGAQ